MPRLMDNEEVMTQTGPGAFQYSGVRVEKLTGASEYTLVTLIIDRSGSVINFEKQILEMLKSVVTSCKRSDRAENLLIRIITFSDTILELHGFRNLSDIDIENDYKALSCGGMTALYDSSYDGIGATIDYAAKLVKDYEFDVNGIVFIATDGCDNRSQMSPSAIKKKVDDALRDESIESLITILIQMKDPASPYVDEVNAHLKAFKEEAGLTQFIDIGDATEGKLAKLANFVSQSISSQSQALGTNSPSQSLTF